MLNIYLIGKNRAVVKIQSLVLKNRYFDVIVKTASSFDEVEATDGIYVIFSSVEEEFNDWQDNLEGKKVYLISFGESDMLDFSIMYNKMIIKNGDRTLQSAIEAGIKTLS